MTPVRRTLQPAAILWLLCHLWIGVLGSVVILAQSAVGGADIACQCQHGVGHECPMHKTPKGKSRCAMRAADDMRGAAGVSSLLGPIGPLPSALVVGQPDDPAAAPSMLHFNTVRRSIPPSLPPPRP
jgi:hypothetical protein